MLNEINKLIKKLKFTKTEVAHIYSIILRCWYELKYMESKNNIINFELNQMKRFKIYVKEEKIYIKLSYEKELELNKRELNLLADQIYDYFSNVYPINYDYRLIDPIYFSLFFYDVLDKIEKTKYDTVNIKDFRLLRKNSCPVTMELSESYKALINGNNSKIYSPFKSNHIIDSDSERLKTSVESIQKNGYPFNNQLVILYNNEPYIRDGQHRVAVLKYLYGNIDVKVVRFLLKDNYFYD